MMGDIKPDPDAEPEDLILKRGFTIHRMREEQPAMNAPSQDTVPGPGSADGEDDL
jgi:hypothetical protein